MCAKRITSLTLALLLMFSLAGCGILDSLRSLGSPFQKADTVTYQVDHDCTGVVTGDAVPCYSERDGDNVVMTLSSGTTVRIYYREYIGEEDWVFTDRGWIYGSYVNTLEDASSGADSAEGIICGDEVTTYEQPSLNANVYAYLGNGKRIEIQGLAGADGILWACTEEGWIPMQYIFMTGAPEPGCVPMELNPDLQLILGQGAGYEQIFPGSSNGVLYLTNILEDNGVLWGEIDHAYWTSLDFMFFPSGIRLFLQDGTLFEPNPGRDMSSYFPGVLVPGDSTQDTPDQPDDPGTQDTPAQPTNPGTQDTPGNGNAPSTGNDPQPPKDTSLVGTWVRFDPDAFLAYGAVDPMNWVFYADGTFYTGGCEYMYMYDRGGWYGASGGWGYGGNYFYDGNELVLEYTHFIGEDGSGESYSNTERYSCRVNGDTVTFGDTTLCRGDEVNPAVHSCIQSNAASRVRSDLVGTWNDNNGTTLTLNADGTFSESGSGSYTGWYLFRDESLYLAYQGRGGFIGMFNISVGDGTLTCQTIYQWETLTIQYTR